VIYPSKRHPYQPRLAVETSNEIFPRFLSAQFMYMDLGRHSFQFMSRNAVGMCVHMCVRSDSIELGAFDNV